MFMKKPGFIKNSLRSKIIYYSIILVAISLFLTSLTVHITSFSIVRNKAEAINKVLTNAAVERTNTLLGELANIINLSLKNEDLEYVIESTDRTSMRFYDANRRYEEYLRNFIVHYDKIDGLVVVNEDVVAKAYNSGVSYKNYMLEAYYDRVASLEPQQARNRFFLERYVNMGYERIAIINPIYNGNKERASACIVVILSSKFSDELQFTGDNIYLMDHRGEYASVNEKQYKPELPLLISEKAEGLDARELVFNGWKIINVSLMDQVYHDFDHNIFYCLIFGTGYLILSILVVLFISKRLVKPILDLNERVKRAYGEGCCEEQQPDHRSRTGFRTRLVLFFLILVIIPVLSITAGYYFRTRSFIENRVGSSFKYNTNLLGQQVESILSKDYRIGVEILSRKEVQEFLFNGGTGLTADFDETKLGEAIINRKSAGQGILNVSLFDSNKNLLFSSLYSRYFIKENAYIKDLEQIDKSYSPLWKGLEKSYLNKGYFKVGLLVRGTTDNVPSGAKLGYIIIDFDADVLTKSLEEYTRNSNASIFLLDNNGNKMMAGSGVDIAGRHSLILPEIQSDPEGKTLTLDNSEYMVISRKLPINNWTMLILVSMKEYVKENQSLLFYSIALVIILIILSFSFSYSFSFVLGRNVDALLMVVRNVKRGNLDIRFDRKTGDEIEELGNSFNDMLERLNLMITDKLMAEVRIKDTEIKAKEYELNLLQAQINPHFLYNTLKTVQYMVFCSDARAEKMIKLLIYLFRTSISKGERLVKLSEELEHVKTYVEIQQIRFSGKFNVTYNIPEDTLELYVLKLTLQPIVENAIYHGLELSVDRGNLLIEVCRDKSHLCIVIADDGAGMSTEKVAELDAQLQGQSESKSIGISNVHERIQLHFGREYGIGIESKKGEGTRITILFPVVDSLDREVC